MTAPTLVNGPNDLHLRRRQQFLYPALYQNVRAQRLQAIAAKRDDVKECIRNPAYGAGGSDHLTSQKLVYHNLFWLWMLDYTAGEKIDVLALRFSDVVDEFAEWNRVNAIFRRKLQEEFPDREVDVTLSAVNFDQQVWYEDALQLVSVAVMLRDARSVKRIIKAMDSNRGIDGLYEQIIQPYLSDDDLYDVDQTWHDEPYQTLLEAFFSESSDESIGLINAYLKDWYKAQNEAPWFDGHMKIVNDVGPYYGYWAFEAGAASFLLDLDDTAIDHMVYPKDLVAYGRQLRSEGRRTSSEEDPLEYSHSSGLRCEANQPCPRSGYWLTPARTGSRRLFKQGEVMPEFSSDWGRTVWQWDVRQ